MKKKVYCKTCKHFDKHRPNLNLSECKMAKYHSLNWYTPPPGARKEAPEALRFCDMQNVNNKCKFFEEK